MPLLLVLPLHKIGREQVRVRLGSEYKYVRHLHSGLRAAHTAKKAYLEPFFPKVSELAADFRHVCQDTLALVCLLTRFAWWTTTVAALPAGGGARHRGICEAITCKGNAAGAASCHPSGGCARAERAIRSYGIPVDGRERVVRPAKLRLH